MYGIKEKTPGMPSIESWIKQNGELLLYNTQKDAQRQVDIWNQEYKDRYFVAEWK